MSAKGEDNDESDGTIFGQQLPETRSKSAQAAWNQGRPLTQRDDTTVIGGKLPEPTFLAPLPSEFKRKASEQAVLPDAKMSLRAAARTSGRSVASGSNPMLAAAGSILGLLGRLRTGMVEMHGAPLRDHLSSEIVRFKAACEKAKIKRAEIDDGCYALAATCDDIAMSLPGSDPTYWRESSLVKTLFSDEHPSTGFYHRYEHLLANPGKREALLELMLACLSLGFQGKYRGTSDGSHALATLRQAGYDRLRNTVPRAGPALSQKWHPVVVAGRRLRPLLPIWMVAGVAAAMVVALFASLAWVLTDEAQSTQNRIIGLHRPVPSVNIARVSVQNVSAVVVYEAPPTGQIDRIQTLLSNEIAQGLTTVQEEGDFIAIRLGDALSFRTGAPTLQSTSPTLLHIAQILEGEPGAIIVEGHSDNLPLSGRGRYKTNEALSAARAETVREVLAPFLSDATRLSAIGVGPSKPLDAADTPAARAKNRRVDILLRKEQQL